MEKKQFEELYRKWCLEKMTVQEWDLFRTSAVDQSTNFWLEEIIEDELDKTEYKDILSKEQLQKAYQNIVIQANQSMDSPRIIKLQRGWWIAAAIIVLIGISTYYWSNHIHIGLNQISKSETLIQPGRNGAILTLASGKKINLSEALQGELIKEAGVIISKSEDGQLVYKIQGSDNEANEINTLSTGKGETYKLRLPDSSVVWLNAASSLTYTVNLVKNGKRTVKLTGEGYFEVAKDKLHPFIVSTNKQEVQVLGTHFNINSYPDEPAITTTLLEGAVKVSSGNLKQVLKPGEQALNNGKSIKVGIADSENITDWKEGGFNLNHQNFKSVMRKIARWYNVEVIYDASIPDDLESGGWISREEKLPAVLKAIASTGLANFRVEGRKLYVTK